MVNNLSFTAGCNTSRHMPGSMHRLGISKKKPLVGCQKILKIRFELRISSGVHRPASAESREVTLACHPPFELPGSEELVVFSTMD